MISRADQNLYSIYKMLKQGKDLMRFMIRPLDVIVSRYDCINIRCNSYPLEAASRQIQGPYCHPKPNMYQSSYPLIGLGGFHLSANKDLGDAPNCGCCIAAHWRYKEDLRRLILMKAFVVEEP